MYSWFTATNKAHVEILSAMNKFPDVILYFCDLRVVF